MFKGTTANKHYIERKGSSSLRPKRVGDNADLAGWDGYDIDYTLEAAIDGLVEFIAILKRIEWHREEYRKLKEQYQPIVDRLKETLPWNDFANLKAQRDRLAAQITTKSQLLAGLKARYTELTEGKASGFYHKLPRVGDPPEWFFAQVACRALPAWVFQSIIREGNLIYREARRENWLQGRELEHVDPALRIRQTAQRLLRRDVFAKLVEASEVVERKAKKKALHMERSGL